MINESGAAVVAREEKLGSLFGGGGGVVTNVAIADKLTVSCSCLLFCSLQTPTAR